MQQLLQRRGAYTIVCFQDVCACVRFLGDLTLFVDGGWSSFQPSLSFSILSLCLFSSRDSFLCSSSVGLILFWTSRSFTTFITRTAATPGSHTESFSSGTAPFAPTPFSFTAWHCSMVPINLQSWFTPHTRCAKECECVCLRVLTGI